MLGVCREGPAWPGYLHFLPKEGAPHQPGGQLSTLLFVPMDFDFGPQVEKVVLNIILASGYFSHHWNINSIYPLPDFFLI